MNLIALWIRLAFRQKAHKAGLTEIVFLIGLNGYAIARRPKQWGSVDTEDKSYIGIQNLENIMWMHRPITVSNIKKNQFS